MARIRTLKPEFWDSPSTAQADLAVRLTFMAMWNWADDSGHGTANLKELEAFVFPNDDVAELPRMSARNSADSARSWQSFAEVCGEVAEAYGVVFYRVKNRPYYWITNFKDHQSKHFRSESRYPHVTEGEIYDVTSGNVISSEGEKQRLSLASADSARNSADFGPSAALVTGEQGNRGTGERDDSASQESGSRKRPSTPLPDDWQPTESHITKARKENIDLDHEAEKFRNDALAKDKRFVDWGKAFHTWLTRVKDFTPSYAQTQDPNAYLWR